MLPPSLPLQVVVMYVGPLLVGLGVTVQSSDWELGYFTRVAQIVSGDAAGWRRYFSKPISSAVGKGIDGMDNACAH